VWRRHDRSGRVAGRTLNLPAAQGGRADSGTPVSTPLPATPRVGSRPARSLTAVVLDVIPIDDLTGRVVAEAAAGGLVAVRWDGHRRPEWVHRADLVTATVAAAVA